MIHVVRTSVTPVKGTALQHPEQITLERYGVSGNRAFLFVDPIGRRYNAGRLGPLMPVRVSHDATAGSLRFALPDGRIVEGSATPDGDPFPVSLWGRDLQVRGVPGPWDAIVTDLLAMPVVLVHVVSEGDGNDVEPLTLVSRASLQALAEHAGADSVDGARFRMTIDIDGVAAHEEDTWTRRRARIGEAVVRFEDPVPRCVVTTWDPQTGVRDLDTLKAIRTYRQRTEDGLPFGMYATVEEPGTVTVGDEVQLLD